MLVWDAFKAQSTDKVSSNLERLKINIFAVPKDSSVATFGSTNNASLKKMYISTLESSASESIRNVYFSLGRLGGSFRQVRPGISTVKRL